ncbi:MAG: hypothetical protein GF401_19600 [Chitinivibrionales bacterium]|nr:hypothetical protein [Chitinivibrionales bacterium]
MKLKNIKPEEVWGALEEILSNYEIKLPGKGHGREERKTGMENQKKAFRLLFVSFFTVSDIFRVDLLSAACFFKPVFTLAGLARLACLWPVSKAVDMPLL